jgi:hypothetical protein
MLNPLDWTWKLREAVERLKTSYAHIGRSSGAPFLAIVYPLEAEAALQREWQALQGMLTPDIEIVTVDILKISMAALDDLGAENIVEAMQEPMPGSNPQAELGNLWIQAVVEEVREKASAKQSTLLPTHRLVLVLQNCAALYPAAGPRELMQALWERSDLPFDGPMVIFIPGKLVEPRVYEYLNQVQEFMYRGDIL